MSVALQSEMQPIFSKGEREGLNSPKGQISEHKNDSPGCHSWVSRMKGEPWDKFFRGYKDTNKRAKRKINHNLLSFRAKVPSRKAKTALAVAALTSSTTAGARHS